MTDFEKLKFLDEALLIYKAKISQGPDFMSGIRDNGNVYTELASQPSGVNFTEMNTFYDRIPRETNYEYIKVIYNRNNPDKGIVEKYYQDKVASQIKEDNATYMRLVDAKEALIMSHLSELLN